MPKLQKTKEGRALAWIAVADTVSKDLPVFYNPVMKHNRDISVLILKTLERKNLHICLPLEASGIRGIRFLKELPAGTIELLLMNDIDSLSAKTMKKNLVLNGIKPAKATASTKGTVKHAEVIVENQEANKLLRSVYGMDYIDIDPFGTPSPFLDSAVSKLNKKGILAVTATDTSALCGTYPQACMRKYWAHAENHPQMHETGIRILIRKIQLIGAQYDRALTPIYSYSKDHYMRVFMMCEKGKEAADRILAKHALYKSYGPLWTGELWDLRTAENTYRTAMEEYNSDNELTRFLKIVAEEAKIKAVGFHDIHSISKRHKISQIPKYSEIISKLASKSHPAAQTHFSEKGIRTTATEEQVIDIIKNLK